jgi:hypothetical protein
MPRLNEHHFTLKDIELALDNGTHVHRMVVGEADDLEATNVLISVWPPGATSSVHSHATDYLELIMEGTLTIGRTEYNAGEGRIVAANQPYGPLVAGPEGCRILHVFSTNRSEPIPAGSAPERELFRGNAELYGNRPGAALGLKVSEDAAAST